MTTETLGDEPSMSKNHSQTHVYPHTMRFRIVCRGLDGKLIWFQKTMRILDMRMKRAGYITEKDLMVLNLVK